MKILVWGNDARGYCIASRLKDEGHTPYCVGPKAAIHDIATELTDSELFGDVLKACENVGVRLVVFSGEKYLVAGYTDRFRHEGIRVYGPSLDGARLEGSKAFCKKFLRRHRVPTAPFRIYERAVAAKNYVLKHGAPIVVKADGLADGKGVFVCQTIPEAFEAIDKILIQNIFHHAKPMVVIEDCLIGRECSFIIVTDGRDYVEMPPACDYKYRFEGNQGPMTGGMGAYAPDPSLSVSEMETIRRSIVERTLEGLRREGSLFWGTLFFGLMITKEGISVLEINVRFGDPETQVTIPLLKSSLFDLLAAVSVGHLFGIEVKWFEDRKAVGVVLVSDGYPGKYETGLEIRNLKPKRRNTFIFPGGIRWLSRTEVVTSSGRVMTVVGVGPSFEIARERARKKVREIHFQGKSLRTDIATGI